MYVFCLIAFQRETLCYNKLKGFILWLFKDLFSYSCLEQDLVWSWAISFKVPPNLNYFLLL